MTLTQTLITRSLAAAFAASAFAAPAHADEAQLMARLEKLAAELEQVKLELAANKKETAALRAQAEAGKNSGNGPAMAAAGSTQAANGAGNQSQVNHPASGSNAGSGNSAVSLPAAGTAVVSAEPARASAHGTAATVISSYGELNFSRPIKNSENSQADAARAVVGISHRFSDKTKFVGEFEWEHAIVSKDDDGEAEVEQLYVEHDLGNGLAAKAGLFLMPVGLLNTNHEPTAYYGVKRNFVESAIIPTTWREIGLGLSKTHDNGVSWDWGLTTGFDLTKWDFDADEGRESPLGSIHGEGQQAKSRNLAMHLALNWRGVPGLLLGGSVFTGKLAHKTTDFAAPNARLTLWDLHARYTPGQWDLSALATRATISDTAALNLTALGKATPVPSSFYGWYMQAAYQLWKSPEYSLSPFLRYEKFNTAQRYSAFPAGLGVAAGEAERVLTFGTNFRIGEGVVLKADYQRFKQDNSRDTLNLGLGYAF